MPIYIATHKQVPINAPSGYEMIQVGAALNEHFCRLTDDAGDNISAKNPNYCELTALYYIWKNVKANDNIVGLVHYRRFFCNNPIPVKEKNIISIESIKAIMNDVDVILPKPYFFKKTVGEQYADIHSGRDLKTCREIIVKMKPEYIDSFDNVMEGHQIHPYNMFIMKYETFTRYMKWLFNILEEAEKEIDISSYSKYNKRALAFMAERLLNVWVKYERLKVKEMNVINIEDSFSARTAYYFKNKLKQFLYN